MINFFIDRKECMEQIGDHWFMELCYIVVYTAEDQGLLKEGFGWWNKRMDLRETSGRIDKTWWHITCKRREKNQRWLAKVSKVINECLEGEDWLYNMFASLRKSEKFWLGDGILVCSEKGRNLEGLHNECVYFVRLSKISGGLGQDAEGKERKKINFWTHFSHRKGFRDVALILPSLCESKGGRKPI